MTKKKAGKKSTKKVKKPTIKIKVNQYSEPANLDSYQEPPEWEISEVKTMIIDNPSAGLKWSIRADVNTDNMVEIFPPGLSEGSCDSQCGCGLSTEETTPEPLRMDKEEYIAIRQVLDRFFNVK